MADRVQPASIAASVSLPTARDLRERANRVGERAALSGTPRTRFLREQRRRVVARMLPTLAMLAVGTGAAAVTDMFRDSGSRWGSLTQGLTASALAGLALASTVARRNLVALTAIAVVAAAVFSAGWGAVAALTGGTTSPYALAVPLGVTVMVVALPLPPRVAPLIAVIGGVATAIACPGAPPSAFVVFLLLAASGYAVATTRRRRSLLSFRRVERLAGAVARIRRVQEQLVMVEKLEALRVLVGGMAHEINNALAVSLASTDQVIKVAERNDPAAVVKNAQRAQGGLVRIRATIDRLRRFAMAEESVLEPADVTAMLDFALESAIGRARSGVIVDRVYEEGLAPVECHVGALAEALFQVAKNAIESMPKGGTVRASARREGERVVLSVADEGSGIPQARLAKVFDPFYARDTVDTLTGGRLLPPLPGRSGLGLSAVYGLVASMGGKVDITSEVGKGTEVAISLPLRRRR